MMKRKAFTLLSGLSVLACAAVAALWVRSYWVDDWFHFYRADPAARWWSARTISSNNGVLYLSWNRVGFAEDGRVEEYIAEHRLDPGFHHEAQLPTDPGRPRDSAWGWLGLAARRGSRVQEAGPRQVAYRFANAWVPHGWVVLATAVPPAWWWVARGRAERRRSRAGRGLCAACGYDLRASAGRCPECGAAVPSGASA